MGGWSRRAAAPTAGRRAWVALRCPSTLLVAPTRTPLLQRRTAPTPSKCPTTSASTGARPRYRSPRTATRRTPKASSSVPLPSLPLRATIGPRRPTVRSGTTARTARRTRPSPRCIVRRTAWTSVRSTRRSTRRRPRASAGPARASMGAATGPAPGSPRRRRARSSVSTRTRACPAPATSRRRRTSWGPPI